MRGIVLCLAWLVIAGALITAGAQDGTVQLLITTQANQSVSVGKKVAVNLAAKGGTPPYIWQITGGVLPPGLSLDRNSGVISGPPSQPGEYHFTVAVTDSSTPPQQPRRDFTLTVLVPSRPLTIDWKEPPKVQGDAVKGSVEVGNHSDQPFDLTVIIVAVNEIDRATALGYQHFTLAPQATQMIPFGSSPGLGRYTVHADAIAEVESTDSIYHARKQTATPLQINEQ